MRAKGPRLRLVVPVLASFLGTASAGFEDLAYAEKESFSLGASRSLAPLSVHQRFVTVQPAALLPDSDHAFSTSLPFFDSLGAAPLGGASFEMAFTGARRLGWGFAASVDARFRIFNDDARDGQGIRGENFTVAQGQGRLAFRWSGSDLERSNRMNEELSRVASPEERTRLAAPLRKSTAVFPLAVGAALGFVSASEKNRTYASGLLLDAGALLRLSRFATLSVSGRNFMIGGQSATISNSFPVALDAAALFHIPRSGALSVEPGVGFEWTSGTTPFLVLGSGFVYHTTRPPPAGRIVPGLLSFGAFAHLKSDLLFEFPFRFGVVLFADVGAGRRALRVETAFAYGTLRGFDQSVGVGYHFD